MKNRNPGREVGWFISLLALVLVLYFVFVRSRMSPLLKASESEGSRLRSFLR
jgi:hypothetical protein